MLWQPSRIKSGPEFQQLNQASGANHTELVLLTSDTSADLPGVQYVFSVDTLIGAEEGVWPILYMGSYPERLAVEEGVTLTLFGLVVQNVNATLTVADSSDGGDGGTTGNSTSSGASGSTDPQAGSPSGWSLSLSSFQLSPGSLLRLVRCEVVLADCSVARRLFQLADPGAGGGGQGEGRQGQQPAGADMVQVADPDVYVASWISDQLEMVDVRVTCSEVCNAASGVRTLLVSSAAALREAMIIVDEHLDGCGAYVIELTGNVSLADALGLPPSSNNPPPPQSQQDSRTTTRRLLQDGHWASAGGLRYEGRTSRASLPYKAHNGARLELGRGRRLSSLSSAVGFNGTARVVVDLTIRGSASTSASSSGTSSSPTVVLDTSLLSSVFVVQSPARLVLERLTLINLVSPQPGVLALPMYFVGAESGGGGAGGGDLRPTVGDVTRVVLRNMTLVLAQDELSYESSWVHDFHDSPPTLSADQLAWLQQVMQEATVQSFQIDALTFTRLRAWDIDASDLRITSTPPPGYSLSQPTIGIAFFSASPLQPYPQIVTLLPSSSTAAAASLSSLLNASAQPLQSQPGTYLASPGVPTLAAVNLPSSGGGSNGSYAPVPYGAVTLQRSYALGPLINASTGALAGGATALPVLDLGRTRATWASFGRPGLRLALRNLTLVGLDSPDRWPADRLVRCLDLPMWALDVARRPSLSGEAAALELRGITISVSTQELQLWAACYKSLSSEAEPTEEEELELLDACRSLGLQVFKITRLGDHAIQVDLLQGMGMIIRNSVLRDDLFPYYRYDIEELLPVPSDGGLGPAGPSTSGYDGDGEKSSSHTKKWIIPVVVVGVVALVTIILLLYVYVRHKRRVGNPMPYINVHMMKMMASGTGIRAYAQDSLNTAERGRSYVRLDSRHARLSAVSRARSTRQGAGDSSGGTIPQVSAAEDPSPGNNTGPSPGAGPSPGRGPGPNADPTRVGAQTAEPKPAENVAGSGAKPWPGSGQRDAAGFGDVASAYAGGGGGEAGVAFPSAFSAAAAASALGPPGHWAATGMAYSTEPYMGGYGNYMEQYTGATATPMYGAMWPGGYMAMPGDGAWEYGMYAGLAGAGWLAGGVGEVDGAMQQAEVPGVQAQVQATAGAAPGAAAAGGAAPTQAGGMPPEAALAVRQAANMQLTPTAAPLARAPPLEEPAPPPPLSPSRASAAASRAASVGSTSAFSAAAAIDAVAPAAVAAGAYTLDLSPRGRVRHKVLSSTAERELLEAERGPSASGGVSHSSASCNHSLVPCTGVGVGVEGDSGGGTAAAGPNVATTVNQLRRATSSITPEEFNRREAFPAAPAAANGGGLNAVGSKASRYMARSASVEGGLSTIFTGRLHDGGSRLPPSTRIDSCKTSQLLEHTWDNGVQQVPHSALPSCASSGGVWCDAGSAAVSAAQLFDTGGPPLLRLPSPHLAPSSPLGQHRLSAPCASSAAGGAILSAVTGLASSTPAAAVSAPTEIVTSSGSLEATLAGIVQHTTAAAAATSAPGPSAVASRSSPTDVAAPPPPSGAAPAQPPRPQHWLARVSGPSSNGGVTDGGARGPVDSLVSEPVASQPAGGHAAAAAGFAAALLSPQAAAGGAPPQQQQQQPQQPHPQQTMVSPFARAAGAGKGWSQAGPRAAAAAAVQTSTKGRTGVGFGTPTRRQDGGAGGVVAAAADGCSTSPVQPAVVSPRPTRRSPFQATSSWSRLSETTGGRSDSSRSLAWGEASGSGGGPAAANFANSSAAPAGGSPTSGPGMTLGAATGSETPGLLPNAGGSAKPGLGKLLVGSLSNLFRVDSLTVGIQRPVSPPPALLASASSLTAPPEGAGRAAAVQLVEVSRAGTPPPAAAAVPVLGQRGAATAAAPGAGAGGAVTAAAGGGRVSGRASAGTIGGGGRSGGGGGGGVALGLEAALNELTADVESRLNENQLVIQQVLGSGAFGTVYKALWKGLQVAVKTMTLTADAVTQGRHAALMEAALSKSIFHPNVVTTYTCDLKPMHVDSRRGGAMTGLQIMNETEVIQEWRLYIVQEFCDGGSLRHAIEARSFLNPASGAPQMEWVLQMAREVAGGLQYLHEHNIIHGDLNPANVLLKRDDNSVLGYAAKIADFGLSVHMHAEQSHVSNTKRGTPFYTAPEVTHAGNLTRFADVFSYGVVLWELYCSRSCWMYGPQGRLVHQRGFPHLPPTCPRAYAQLVSSCMQPAHKQRPTFKQIGVMLESMQREIERARGEQEWWMLPVLEQGGVNGPALMPALPQPPMAASPLPSPSLSPAASITFPEPSGAGLPPRQLIGTTALEGSCDSRRIPATTASAAAVLTQEPPDPGALYPTSQGSPLSPLPPRDASGQVSSPKPSPFGGRPEAQTSGSPSTLYGSSPSAATTSTLSSGCGEGAYLNTGIEAAAAAGTPVAHGDPATGWVLVGSDTGGTGGGPLIDQVSSSSSFAAAAVAAAAASSYGAKHSSAVSDVSRTGSNALSSIGGSTPYLALTCGSSSLPLAATSHSRLSRNSFTTSDASTSCESLAQVNCPGPCQTQGQGQPQAQVQATRYILTPALTAGAVATPAPRVAEATTLSRPAEEELATEAAAAAAAAAAATEAVAPSAAAPSHGSDTLAPGCDALVQPRRGGVGGAPASSAGTITDGSFAGSTQPHLATSNSCRSVPALAAQQAAVLDAPCAFRAGVALDVPSVAPLHGAPGCSGGDGGVSGNLGPGGAPHAAGNGGSGESSLAGGRGGGASSASVSIMRAFEIPTEASRFGRPDLPTVPEAEDEAMSCASATPGSISLAVLAEVALPLSLTPAVLPQIASEDELHACCEGCEGGGDEGGSESGDVGGRHGDGGNGGCCGSGGKTGGHGARANLADGDGCSPAATTSPAPTAAGLGIPTTLPSPPPGQHQPASLQVYASSASAPYTPGPSSLAPPLAIAQHTQFNPFSRHFIAVPAMVAATHTQASPPRSAVLSRLVQPGSIRRIHPTCSAPGGAEAAAPTGFVAMSCDRASGAELEGPPPPPPPPPPEFLAAGRFARPTLGNTAAAATHEALQARPLPALELLAPAGRFARPTLGNSAASAAQEAVQPYPAALPPPTNPPALPFARPSLASASPGGVVLLGPHLPPLPTMAGWAVGGPSAVPTPPTPPMPLAPAFARPNMEVLKAAPSSAAGSMAPATWPANHHPQVPVIQSPGPSAGQWPAAWQVPAGQGYDAVPDHSSGTVPGVTQTPASAKVTAALNLDPDLPRFARARQGRQHDPDDLTPDLPGPAFASPHPPLAPSLPPPGQPVTPSAVHYTTAPDEAVWPQSVISSLARGPVSSFEASGPLSYCTTVTLGPMSIFASDGGTAPRSPLRSPSVMSAVQLSGVGAVSGVFGSPLSGSGNSAAQGCGPPYLNMLALAPPYGGYQQPPSRLGMGLLPGISTPYGGPAADPPGALSPYGAPEPPRFERDGIRDVLTGLADSDGSKDSIIAVDPEAGGGKEERPKASDSNILMRTIRAAVTGGIAGRQHEQQNPPRRPAPCRNGANAIAVAPAAAAADRGTPGVSGDEVESWGPTQPGEVAALLAPAQVSEPAARGRFDRTALHRTGPGQDEAFPCDLGPGAGRSGADTVLGAAPGGSSLGGGRVVGVRGSSFDEALRLAKSSLSTVPESGPSVSQASIGPSSYGAGDAVASDGRDLPLGGSSGGGSGAVAAVEGRQHLHE